MESCGRLVDNILLKGIAESAFLKWSLPLVVRFFSQLSNFKLYIKNDANQWLPREYTKPLVSIFNVVVVLHVKSNVPIMPTLYHGLHDCNATKNNLGEEAKMAEDKI